MSPKPNIIWICTDQQRSDSLGCYGNPIVRTPNLDALAAAGTRFNRHITPMQICSPSRATMFTGLYPRNHELITNGMALDPEMPTLTGLLADAGYRTHSVGKQHLQPILAPDEYNMPDSRAFWRSDAADDWNGPYYGFQTLDLLIGESDTAAISGHYARWLKANAPGAAALLKVDQAPESPPADLDEIWRSAIPSELHYNSWISDCASKFIKQADADNPFFLFVSYPDPHHPFAPPIEYADRYNPADMPLPRLDPGERERLPEYYETLFPTDRGFRELYWAGLPDMEAGSMIDTAGVSDDSMRRAIAHTYGMIEMIDDGVGRILKTLAQQGQSDNTIVLFTSDHGELLGTHGLLHKGPPSYRQLVEVSLTESPPADLDEIWRSAIPSELHYNSWISDCASKFIKQADADNPFFLFVSYPDPHHPFAPPIEYADRYNPADMPLPRLDPGERERLPEYYETLFPTDRGFRELYWAGLPDMEAGSMIDTAGVSDDSMRRAIAHTYGMIEMIDDGVGRILKTLAQQGQSDNTIVLFTSDHGELLGTHGLLHKGPPSYRQLVEVSLLMKGPFQSSAAHTGT